MWMHRRQSARKHFLLGWDIAWKLCICCRRVKYCVIINTWRKRRSREACQRRASLLVLYIAVGKLFVRHKSLAKFVLSCSSATDFPQPIAKLQHKHLIYYDDDIQNSITKSVVVIYIHVQDALLGNCHMECSVMSFWDRSQSYPVYSWIHYVSGHGPRRLPGLGPI